MDVSILDQIGPTELRTIFLPFLGNYLNREDERDQVLAEMGSCVAALSDEQLAGMLEHMRAIGKDYTLHEAHGVARTVTRRWAHSLLGAPEVRGLEHLLDSVAQGPTVILSNHLSYFDANIVDVALETQGQDGLSRRLMVAAGPKVYSDLFRLFAAASLATVKVPQSTSLGHTEQMSGRELARRAISSLKAARHGLEEGRFLLIYPEGSRTRTGRMCSWLKAVYRYAELVPCRVVPATVEGADEVMPVGSMKMQRAATTIRFGEPFEVGPKGGKQALERAREQVASMLPMAMRPADGDVAFV